MAPERAASGAHPGLKYPACPEPGARALLLWGAVDAAGAALPLLRVKRDGDESGPCHYDQLAESVCVCVLEEE